MGIFLHGCFFLFLRKKVGIVGHFEEKVGKSRSTTKNKGKEGKIGPTGEHECCIPSFKVICLLLLKIKIFKSFSHTDESLYLKVQGTRQNSSGYQ